MQNEDAIRLEGAAAGDGAHASSEIVARSALVNERHAARRAPSLLRWILLAGALASIAGCTSYSHTNVPLSAKPASNDARATLDVRAERGNPRVLMFLALSGGGSRAAYLSAATMLKLQTVFPDADLMAEVDVISAVSGGSLPAAFYTLTKDEAIDNAALLQAAKPLTDAQEPSKLRLGKEGSLRCEAALSDAEAAHVIAAMGRTHAARTVIALCAQAGLRLRPWNTADVLDRMGRDYLARWIGSWFLPNNVLRYWFTAFDRSDIMAQTLADNLLDSPLLGNDYTFGDLNATRPYLIVNATNATEQSGATLAEYPFGGVFSFTAQDFEMRLASDIGRYSVARAVAASSSFPLVFPSMTLRDFRAEAEGDCAVDRAELASERGERPAAERCESFLHLFDGGNADNLGLRSVKRALFRAELDGQLRPTDRVIVLLVDAFTKPAGTPRSEADPRSLLGMVLDTNLTDAVDSLLQTNRANAVREFQSGSLGWDVECSDELRSLPRQLCERLARRFAGNRLDLSERMFFYHFGFDDVQRVDPDLKQALDRIPTSFRISERHRRRIDKAVDLVLTRDNECLQATRDIVLDAPVSVRAANERCQQVDAVPRPPIRVIVEPNKGPAPSRSN